MRISYSRNGACRRAILILCRLSSRRPSSTRSISSCRFVRLILALITCTRAHSHHRLSHRPPSFVRTQVVLLNLLIALMGEARAQAATEASLNAFRRRAELILEQEEFLKSADDETSLFLIPVGGFMCNLKNIGRRLCCSPEYAAEKQKSGAKKATKNRVGARWLHVLVPDELENEEAVEKQLRGA